MSYSKQTNNLSHFRPLKDFEDQLDEIFERSERVVFKNRKKHRVSKVKRAELLVKSDSREIDDEDVLTLPVREKINAIIEKNCVG